MIRVVETSNPKWYSELYQRYSGFRRDLSLRSLERISKEQDRLCRSSRFIYDYRYRKLIHERLAYGFEEDGCEIPPIEEIRSQSRLEEMILEENSYENF